MFRRKENVPKVFRKYTESVLLRIFVESKIRNTFEHTSGTQLRTHWEHILAHLRNVCYLSFNDGCLLEKNINKMEILLIFYGKFPFFEFNRQARKFKSPLLFLRNAFINLWENTNIFLTKAI